MFVCVRAAGSRVGGGDHREPRGQTERSARLSGRVRPPRDGARVREPSSQSARGITQHAEIKEEEEEEESLLLKAAGRLQGPLGNVGFGN